MDQTISKDYDLARNQYYHLPDSMGKLINNENKRSEIHEVIVSRNPDLATAYCINERTEGLNYSLAFKKDEIIKQAIAQDRDMFPSLGTVLGIGVYTKKNI